MAADQITKLGYLFTGQDQVEKYLTVTQKVATQIQALQRLGEVRTGAFEGLAMKSMSQGSQNDLLNASVRQYDPLLGSAAQLRIAELQRSQANLRLDARGQNFMRNPVERELLDLKSRAAVNAASERLAKAYLKAMAAVELEEQAARRRAVLGQGTDSLFNAKGQLDFPTRNDPRSQQVVVDNALKQARNETRLREKQQQETDLAAGAALGKQFVIQKKRTEQENLDRANELGKQYTIQAKRIQQEDLNNAAALGKQFVIQKKRSQQEDINRSNELGKQFNIQQKRTQQEDMNRANELGKQFRITKLRGQQEDLAAYNERARLAENERQRGIYAQSQSTPFPNASPTTPVGRAQTDVNAAANRLSNAQQARADLEQRGTITAKQLLASDAQLQSANTALIAARDRLAQAETRAGVSGFRGQFGAGFKGASDRPYAEQLGQAFKFSVFYGTAYKLLFGLTQTLQQSLQEGIAFESAMTELKIASGASADAADDMAKALGAQATAAGAAPSQGVLLGARSLGLFGATESSGASEAEQQRIAEMSTRVALRMALGTKTDPALLQTQIAAVANAFGTGPAGQLQAADLDAYLGRKFGVTPGETIQSVAESGTVGQAAGFNQEEVFAIAAALQSRTGQSSSAVAGWMAQIFSRGGEGSLTALTGKYGIDTSADLATQIRELSQVYKDASNPERAEIAAGFGRGKVQNAAVVLLDEFGTIDKEAKAARSGSSGAADKIFDDRMNDIGGQIQQTVAVLKAFASELGQSGILDVLGGVIVGLRELVEAATTLLQIWNELPSALKTAVAGIVLLGLASRTAALSTGGGALLRGAGLISPSLAASTGVRAPVGSIVAGAGLSGIATAGKAALTTVGPWALAAGGLLAVAALKSSADRMRAAQESATEALNNSGLGSDATSADYLASASELDNLATQNRDATGGFTGGFKNFVTGGHADDANIEMAEALEREATRRRNLADRIDAASSNISAEAPAITGFDPQGLSESMDLITASGGTAATRLDALADALRGTADAAVNAASEIDPDIFSGKLAGIIKDGVNDVGRKIPASSLLGPLGGDKQFKVQRSYQVLAGYESGEQGGAPIYESRPLSEVFTATPTQLQQRLRKQLKKQGITSTSQLDSKKARELADSIIEDSDFEVDPDDLADARQGIIDMVFKSLRKEAKGWRDLLKMNRDLTSTELVSVINQITGDTDEAVNDLPENDLKGRAAQQRKGLRNLLLAKNSTSDDDMPLLLQQIGKARANVARAEIERLDQVRRAAQQNATSAKQIRGFGMRTIRGRVAAAVESRDVDVLAEVIANSGKMGVRIARKSIETAIAAAREALKVQAAYAAIQASMNGVAGLIGGVAGMSEDLADLSAYQNLADNLGNIPWGSAEETLKGTDVEGTDKYFPDKKSPEDKKAEREQARQEMLDLKNNLYLLSIDLSDPLAQAVAAVKDARRRLQSDISSGQKPGQIAADRVALRQAEIEREATAFQQRLDAVQTADELGRISHRKYISYLDSERKRLGAIKNRTYQQQQLDEIDRLMKDAAEAMQGQWNFGDIKLPTPYQVRRQVEQMRLDAAGPINAVSARAAAGATTTINIDGADIGKVRQIIKDTLGSANTTVTNRPRRR